MNPTRRIRTIVAAMAVALLIPTVASAEPTAPEGPPPVESIDGPRAKSRKKRPSFPMTGDQFTRKVDNRLKRLGARLAKRLDQAKIPEKVKNEIRADYKKGAVAVRRAAHKAAADGTVTRKEAKKVRQLARKVKQQMRQKWGKKGKRSRKGKGKRRGRGSDSRGGNR